MKVARVNIIFAGLFILASSLACSGGGGSGGGGGGGATNKFSAASRAMTMDDLAPSTRTGTEEYHGSFLSKDGGTIYSGAFSFVLENDGVNVKFKSFTFGKVVSTSSYTTAPSQVTAGASCFSNTGDPATNHIVMMNTTERLVKFDLDLVNCNPTIDDLEDVGILFSNDFSTFVGGDDSTFFMIAQKASSAPAYTISNVAGTLSMLWFSIDVNGDFQEESGYAPTVTVSGATWTADENSGTLKATDSTSGGFLYKYSATAATNIDGGFLVAPDKSFVLGVDLLEGVYFAASK